MTSEFTSGLKTIIDGQSSGSGTWYSDSVHFATGMVHAGVAPDRETGAILTPIYHSTTFVQESIEKYQAKGYSYSRSHNPTITALEERITAAENGARTCVFGTGMAATCTVFSALMQQGDHAIISNCSYGGTNRACRVFFTKFGMTFDFVDMSNLKEVEAAIKPNTKVIFSESPTNPTLNLADLQAVSDIARAKNIVHVADMTLATPYICRALDFGVDVVLHSTTKFYDGHNITVGGSLTSRTTELDGKFRFVQNILGNIMTPQVAFYQLQCAKTLGLRIKQQSDNAMKVARFLETHPKVMRVSYPGLDSHPQKALADKQHKGGNHGALCNFEVHGGSEAGRKLMDSIQRPWSLCENLGSTESIITCPSVMTHANMLKEDRLKVGITDGLVRVSCGIEDGDDLVAALKKALDSL